MKRNNYLKAGGGILVNGALLLVSKYLAGADKNLTGGILTDIVGDIGKNFITSHFGSLGTYNLLYDAVLKKHPTSLNHDIERLIKEAAFIAVDLLGIIYIEELKNDVAFFIDSSPKEIRQYVSQITQYFSQARKNIRDSLDVYDVSNNLIEDPDAYFAIITDYLVGVSAVTLSDACKQRLIEFHKRELPACFQLAFKEALKNDDPGFKSFQLATLQELKDSAKDSAAVLVKIEKSVQKINNGENLVTVARIDKMGTELIRVLNSRYKGIEHKLKEFSRQIVAGFDELYAVNSLLLSQTRHLNKRTAALYDITKSTDRKTSAILDTVNRMASKKEFEFAQRVFSGSVEVLELISEIEALPQEIERINQKHKSFLEKYQANPDYAELVTSTYKEWESATQRLEVLSQTLDKTKSTVVSLYHLLFKQSKITKRSKTISNAIILFEEGRFTELENFLSSEAREREREQLIREQELLDQKKKDLALGDLLNAVVILRNRIQYDSEGYAKAKLYFEKSIATFTWYDNLYYYAQFLEDAAPDLAIQYYEKSFSFLENTATVEYGKRLSDIGRIYSQSGKVQKAIDYFTKTKELFNTDLGIPAATRDYHIIQSQVSLAITHRARWDMQQAREYLTAALAMLNISDVSSMPKYPELRIHIYSTLGDFESSVENLIDAEAYYKMLLDYIAEIEEQNPSERCGNAAMFFNIAMFYLKKSEWKEAMRLYERGAALSSDQLEFLPVSKAVHQVAFHHGMASAHNLSGSYESAKEEYQKGILICRQFVAAYSSQFLELLTGMLIDLANMLLRNDDLTNAEILYEEAMGLIVENLPDSSNELYSQLARMAITYADLLLSIGNYTRAQGLYQETLQFLYGVVGIEKHFLRPELAELLARVAEYCEKLKEHPTAIDLYNKSIEEYELVIASTGSAHLARLIHTLICKAVLHANLNEWDEALAPIERAIQLCEDFPDKQANRYLKNLSGSLVVRAGLWAKLGEVEKSIEDFRRAEAMVMQLNAETLGRHDYEVAYFYQNYSILYEVQKDWPGGIAVLNRALAIWSRLFAGNPAGYGKQLAQIMLSMAIFYSRMGDTERQLDTYDTLIQTLLGNAISLSSSWQILASVYRQLQHYYYEADDLNICVSYMVKERALLMNFGENEEAIAAVETNIKDLLVNFTYDKEAFDKHMEQEYLAIMGLIALSYNNRNEKMGSID